MFRDVPNNVLCFFAFKQLSFDVEIILEGYLGTNL